jgi:ketosteroid isomerase-like protein
MEQPNTDAAIRNLLDRQAIRDCIDRYCRATDRRDEELLMSVYHDDAVDDHGGFVGGRENFAEWGRRRDCAGGPDTTQHHITTHNCEIDGDQAHAETYYFFTARNKDGSIWQAGGRYLDRFERRAGEWRIAARYCTVEWSGTINEGAIPFADLDDVHANGVPQRSREDPSYRRPLVNRRAIRIPWK